MAHNYEEFPFPDFKHAIKSGKNTYRNKFFHDIDLSFLLKWMESIEGENYTIRIVGDKLQLIDGEGQVVSEVTLSEGQQGPPGVTPNVSAAAFVDDGTGTPSVEVVKSGTTENPTFSFNFSNLKGATGATGPASTVPGPAGTPFQVKAQYDTYAEMIAAHPTGEVGDAYQVGENSGLATVATTGDYDDLINKPTIPAAQVNSDWNANSGVAEILNKPTIPTVNNPTITITQGGVTKGSFTLNQTSAATIDVDAGGGGGSTYDLSDAIILAKITDYSTTPATVYHNFASGNYDVGSGLNSLSQSDIETGDIIESNLGGSWTFQLYLNCNTNVYRTIGHKMIDNGVLKGKYIFTTYPLSPTWFDWFKDSNNNAILPSSAYITLEAQALNFYFFFNSNLDSVNIPSISSFIEAFKGIWFEQT